VQVVSGPGWPLLFHLVQLESFSPSLCHVWLPQVLHYLETLSPLALFSQLLAAAVSEALALLAASRGAALPAAAAVVDRSVNLDLAIYIQLCSHNTESDSLTCDSALLNLQTVQMPDRAGGPTVTL